MSVVVSDDIAAAALAYAKRYVNTEYEVAGELERGVAYMWGGRMSVEDYLAAIEAGATPGDDAGVDASAVVVRSYLAAQPGLRFETAGGQLIADATSSTLYHYNVEFISVEQLRPGDLIFFGTGPNHVTGVALFDRREGPNVHFIIASPRAGKVIQTFYNVNNETWNNQFVAAGRLIQKLR